MEVTNLKTIKYFSIIINKAVMKIISVSQYQYCKVAVDRYKNKKFLLYLTLTLLGYRLLGVKLDNGVLTIPRVRRHS